MNIKNMQHGFLLTIIAAAIQCAGLNAVGAAETELRGPIDTQGTTALPDKDTKTDMGGLSTPSADAVMTPDLLLVNPTKASQAQPLTAYIGMNLKLEVQAEDIKYKDLHGLKVTVVNDTNRALLINGDKASARLNQKTYSCSPVTDIDLAISPEQGAGRVVRDFVTIVAPAAATIGVVPTAEDIAKMHRPVLDRYGQDEERRRAEASRFGKRILWPHEQTQGVVYFKTEDNISGAKLEIPVSTLFDQNDAGTLISSP